MKKVYKKAMLVKKYRDDYHDINSDMIADIEEKIGIGTILTVYQTNDIICLTEEYKYDDGDDFSFEIDQLAFPIKANRLSRKMYPNAPEKDGMLWIKEDE